MSPCKQKTLLLHVGLPKTGSTTIQDYLYQQRLALASCSFQVLSSQGHGHHFALAHQLLSLDVPGGVLPADYAADVDLAIDQFPVWGDAATLIISEERLCSIGPSGAAAVEDYASRHAATIRVAVVIRDQLDWLYSMWTQDTKIQDADWCEHVKSLSAKRLGFLSKTCSAWAQAQTARVSLLNYQRTDFLPVFCERFQIPYIAQSVMQHQKFLNKAHSTAECLYRAALHALVFQLLNGLAPEIPRGFVNMQLLFVSEEIRPVYEVTKRFEDHVQQNQSEAQNYYGSDSFPYISAYLSQWAEDARDFYRKHESIFDDKSQLVIKFLIEKASSNAEQLHRNPVNFKQLPQNNAASILPIDSQFVSLARTIAHLIASKHVKVDRAPSKQLTG
ncbi:MAG: hypothetical protein WCP04_10040 [Pseudomonadota bacterium]